MEPYYTLLDYLNNHDTLSSGDFNYVFNWVNTTDDEPFISALYCFLISKIIHCKQIGVKLNRPNALLHVKEQWNNQELIHMIESAMCRKEVSNMDPIVVMIVFYFLHIDEHSYTNSTLINVMLDAYKN